MVSTDWQTVLARRSRKEAPSAGGWSAFTTTLATTDILDPVVSFFTGAACEKASIGWPCDEKIEKLRDDFARTTDPAKRKELAEALQVRLAEFPTYAPLGQFNMPVAMRCQRERQPRGAGDCLLERQEGTLKQFGRRRNDGGRPLAYMPPVINRRSHMADINGLKKGLIVTAFWEAKPGEVDALVGIIKKFLPQAQAEPGVLAFQIHQSLTEPTKFFFYEVFRDEAAFAEHSQAEHFKSLILEQAVPRLAKRERSQHKFV